MPDRYSLPKAIGWSIAFVVLTLLSAGLLAFGVAAAIAGDPQGALTWMETNGLGATLVQAGATLASTALATWLIGMRVLGLTLTDLRYRVPQRGTGFGLGALVGAGAAGVSLAIGAIAGGAEWFREQGTLASYAEAAATTTLILAPAALSEEVLFRGVPLVLLASALGRGSAGVLLAIGFSLAHLANPNVTMLGIGNIALAGVFLGLAFYAPGGIWTAWGAHLGWNAILAALDTPVSGVPFPIPLLDYEPGDPAWLTGGQFGPEGGLASTIALTIAVLVARRWAGKDSA
jgi:membrane protease YdiL (CAAX protease family)